MSRALKFLSEALVTDSSLLPLFAIEENRETLKVTATKADCRYQRETRDEANVQDRR